MDISISHPGLASAPGQMKIIGVDEWKEIVHEDLPAVSISTPNSSGLENDEHLIRGTVTWAKDDTDAVDITEEDILQIGEQSEQVIVIDSEESEKARRIAECRSAMDTQPDNITVIAKAQQERLDDLTALPVIRSHSGEPTSRQPLIADEPESTFELDGSQKPDSVEFIQEITEELITDDVVENYKRKQLDYLRILYLRDHIRRELDSEKLEYLHQHAAGIVEIVDAKTIPSEVVDQSDIDISTPVDVMAVEQATYCIASYMAGVIDQSIEAEKATVC